MPCSLQQIFFQERYDDILAANPALFAEGPPDRRAALSAASVWWRERLSDEERVAYRQRAAQEKEAAAKALAEVWRGRPERCRRRRLPACLPAGLQAASRGSWGGLHSRLTAPFTASNTDAVARPRLHACRGTHSRTLTMPQRTRTTEHPQAEQKDPKFKAFREKLAVGARGGGGQGWLL